MKMDMLISPEEKRMSLLQKTARMFIQRSWNMKLSLSPYIEESFVFSSTQPGESDISIVASIRPDMEFIREELPTEPTDQDIKTILWEEVDKMNRQRRSTAESRS